MEVAAGQVGQQPAIAGQQYQVSVRAVGRLSEPAQFDNIILEDERRRHAGSAEGRGACGTWARRTMPRICNLTGKMRSDIAVTQLSTANALDVDRQSHCRTRPAIEEFPARDALQAGIRHDGCGGRIDPRRRYSR